MLPQYAQAAQSAENPSDAYVLSILAECQPVIRRVARSYELDVEDLTQDLAVKMLERPRSLKNPVAYYTTAVQHMAITRASKDLGAPHLSLDVPAYRGAEETYGDLLIAPPAGVEADHSKEDRCAEALYAAFARLPLEEQEYLCTRNDIHAYTPTDTGARLQHRSPRPGPRSRNTLSVHAHRHIRADNALRRDVEAVYATLGIRTGLVPVL
jgi:DNA-directed RNA polymerase specialized sigma24 family protein